MDLYDIFQDLENNVCVENAVRMRKYLRNKFDFLGIQTPKRREISKPYFKLAKQTKSFDWEFVNYCWKKPYREAQHVAIDYLKLMKGHLGINDIPQIKELIVSKSWWDTVDGLFRTIGDIALQYPQVEETLLLWSIDENIWLRRTAITHQILRKEQMNEVLLEKILINNLNQVEFFINKAIGWILRDYSKTNPKWVTDFIEKNKDSLSNLSIKEGSKYL